MGKIMTHQNRPHLPFCTPGKNSRVKQSKDITNITRETQDKQTQNRQMETHPTLKDSKLQGIHEHHPSNSKHVKYSVQLKERIESNITSQNMHCITQISRLLFTLKGPLKKKHQTDLASL